MCLDAEKLGFLLKQNIQIITINLVTYLISNDQAIRLISARGIDWITRYEHLTGILIGGLEHQGKG